MNSHAVVLSPDNSKPPAFSQAVGCFKLLIDRGARPRKLGSMQRFVLLFLAKRVLPNVSI